MRIRGKGMQAKKKKFEAVAHGAGLVLLLFLALASEPAVVFVVMKSAMLLGQMNDIPVQLRVLNRE
jgi:hypothetical protein